MTDNLRKHLQSRSKRALSKSITATPSERKSEKLRMKLNRGQPDLRELPEDCRSCPREPCGMTISMCGEKMMVGRCMTCGIKYRYRFIFGEFGFRCKGCRDKMEMKGEV